MKSLIKAALGLVIKTPSLGQGRDSVKAILTDNPDLCEELEAKIVEAMKA